MSGRLEMDQKNEELIKKRLAGRNPLIQAYMLSIENKTSSTRYSYLNYLIEFSDFLKTHNIEIQNVKPMDVDLYKKRLLDAHNGPSIINSKLSAIISFYKFLIKNDIVTKNPCDTDMKLKIQEKDSVIYMTDKEVKEVKERIITRLSSSDIWRKRDLCIVTLGCSTGLRVSALVNIDIDDIDFENKTITVIEKGNKRRLIYIGDNTLKCIKEWILERNEYLKDCPNQTDALFVSNRKKRLDTDAVRYLLNKEANDFGKRITPHKMRSTCGMKLYGETGDIYLTSQQLGHANIKNTTIYAKATEEKRRMAADLLD